jgi:hypothetical protein
MAPPVGQDAYVNAKAPSPNEPPIGSTTFWTWLVMLIFLFMALVLVAAIIQANAQ